MNLNDPQYADMSTQDLLDEGLIQPEDVWTNMIGETMILTKQAVFALEAMSSDFGEELTDEQIDLFYSDTEGTA